MSNALALLEKLETARDLARKNLFRPAAKAGTIRRPANRCIYCSQICLRLNKSPKKVVIITPLAPTVMAESGTGNVRLGPKMYAIAIKEVC